MAVLVAQGVRKEAGNPGKAQGPLWLEPHETASSLRTAEEVVETWPPRAGRAAAWAEAGAGWGHALEVSPWGMVLGSPGQKVGS